MTISDLEVAYWSSITKKRNKPIYYSDQDRTFFYNNVCKSFNLNHLDDYFTKVCSVDEYDWKGINQPYSYFGNKFKVCNFV